jgi:hypothetical protein
MVVCAQGPAVPVWRGWGRCQIAEVTWWRFRGFGRLEYFPSRRSEAPLYADIGIKRQVSGKLRHMLPRATAGIGQTLGDGPVQFDAVRFECAYVLPLDEAVQYPGFRDVR